MGAWGTNLYQNDVAGDIKQDYISKQKAGKSEEQALEEIMQEYAGCFEDDDDKYDAWFALADTMWKYGRLTEVVKQKVLSLIEEEKNSGRWETPKDIKKRQKVLEDLSEKLQSEQPPKKRISVHKPFIPKWKPKEVYQYKIQDDMSNFPRGEKYLGWYVIIYVEKLVEEEMVVKGVTDLLPMVYLKLSKEELTDVSQVNEKGIWVNYGGWCYQYLFLETSGRLYTKYAEYLGVCENFIHPEYEIIDEERYGFLTWNMVGIDAIKGKEVEIRAREKYKAIRYITEADPIVQKKLEKRHAEIINKKYIERSIYANEIVVKEASDIHSSYKTPWEADQIYHYKIEDVPKGKEKYKNWYLFIYVYQLRGMERAEQGVQDIVPDVYIQVVDDKTPLDDIWVMEYLPFVHFLNEDGSIHSYKGVIAETDAQKYPESQIEKSRNYCVCMRFPQMTYSKEMPQRLTWDNIVEKSIEGYEWELERLGYNKEDSTLEILRKRIENLGGIEKVLEMEW